MQNIVDIVTRDMRESGFPIPIILRLGDPEEFPALRDYAYTFQNDSGELVVVVSQKMENADSDRIQAIMRHELAHAWFINSGNFHHSELETDQMAEKLWGDRIYYDDDDIQTLEYGTHPRPPYLPK